VTVLRSWIALAIVLFSLSARGLESPANEFSADVVSRDGHGKSAATVARLYASGGKVRIEATDLPDGFFLIDRDAPSALLVRPGQRIYMNARQSSVLTQVFVPVDAANPCPQWLAAFTDALNGKGVDHWRCESRPQVSKGAAKIWAFRVVTADQSVDQRIIDAKLQFPVKLISADGSSLSLEKIRLAPQAADLFVVPRGYQAFDPRAVVERIKQSDVWAGPPDK
jgi:hypothetical protein